NHVFFGVLAILAVYVSGAVFEPEAAVPVEPVTVVDEVDVSPSAEVSPLAEGVERSAASTRNLNVGSIAAGNRLLYSNYFIKYPMVNAIQSQDVTYRG
ncbi:hypothetical protein H4F41_25365, partial [Escherichia coli]|nr:hypothetical protein [Escherichia coli]